MIVMTLIAISLLVLSVSATPSIEGPVMGTGSTTITGDLAPFAAKHAMSIDGEFYLTHPFDQKTLYEYIECEKLYLQKNTDAKIVLNIEGHGWFSNNEVIARSDGKNVTVMLGVINQLLPEIETNQLKWLGVKNPTDKWIDVVWGALQAKPTPYFLKFADKHARKTKDEYYLTHKFDKDALFDYIDNEVMHLAQRSSNAMTNATTLKSPPEHPKMAIAVRIYDPEMFSRSGVLVAETFDTSSSFFANIQDKTTYTIAELRNHPEKYTGWHIVWKGQYSAVCVDMGEINTLLSNIPYQQFGYMEVRTTTATYDRVGKEDSVTAMAPRIIKPNQ